jgi:hypothetical protein
MDNTGLQALRIEDFSGGITDFYLGGSTRKYQVADNFVINENNDLITRPGCASKYNYRLTASGTIKNIIDNQDEILMQQNKSVIYVDGDGVHEIKSPSTHDVFVGAPSSIDADFSYWNKHTLGVSDNYNSPQKIYKDANDAWTVTTLGLPEILYATSVALANEIRTQYEAHRVDETQHTVAADTVNVVTATVSSDLDTFYDLCDELAIDLQAHFDDAVAAPAYHTATFDRDLDLDSITSIRSAYNALELMKDGFNAHEGSDAVHAVEDLYTVSDDFLEPAASGGAGAVTRIIGLNYVHRYAVGDLEFLERGPIHLIELENVAATGSFDVYRIPELDSGALENWDDANVKIQVYRTVSNGTTLFLETEIDNGTTSVTLSMTDDELQLQPTAYTEGGILDDERPPPAKFIVTVNDITYFGAVKEDKKVLGNRLRSTKPGAPYSSPASFYCDFEDDFVGMGYISTYPIVFLSNSFYRVEGSFDSAGRGGMVKRSISQRIGCISDKSIVTTKDGIYFAAEDGFYFTDGFTYRKISDDINLTYKALEDKDQICGAYNSLRNRVHWGVKVDGNNTNNDTVLVACLDYKTEYNGHPILMWNGGLDATNFTCTALAYINNELLRADENGYLLYHDDDLLSDVDINTSIDPDDWYTQTIFYDHVSVGFDFGNAQVRKWVSKININANNQSSLSLQPSASNDNSGVFTDLKIINARANVEWGDPSIVWGESDLRWNYNPVISEWRWMPASDALRCMYKQVRFTNAYTLIEDSTYSGAASGVAATKKILLLNYPTNEWMDDPVNYYISFDVDDYENEYKILSVSGGELTVEDDDAALTDFASAEWKIKGYKKREIFNLLNYVIGYRVISMTQDTYRASEASE